MKLPEILVDWVLKSDNAQEKIRKETESVAKTVAEKAAELVKQSGRSYVIQSPTNTKQYEAESGKSYDTLYEMYKNAPGSVQCANRIASAVMGQGYVIKPKKGYDRRTTRDLKRLINLFDAPNEDDTIEGIVQAGLVNYLAYGDWYIEKNGLDTDSPRLYNLNTATTSILVDKADLERGVMTKTGYKRYAAGMKSGKGVLYTLDEVIQIRRPNPRAGVYGQAVLEDNQAVLTLLLQALNFNISMLQNGGRPPMKLELPEDSTENDAQRLLMFWEKLYAGPMNSGKPLILFAGAKADKLGIGPQDIAYLDLLEYGMKLVSGQYGVPVMLIGFPEGANRSSSSELRRSFYYTVVEPLRKIISQKITTEVIEKGMGIQGWQFDFRSAGLEESESTRRDVMTAVEQGLMSWNEARVKMGLIPLEEEWANKYFLIGTKNDSMLEVEETIGREPDESAPDKADLGDGNSQGEGADAGDE